MTQRLGLLKFGIYNTLSPKTKILKFPYIIITMTIVDARIFSFKGGLRIPENKVSVLTLPLSTQYVGLTSTNEISNSHPTGTFELGSCDTCRIVSMIVDYVAKVRMSPSKPRRQIRMPRNHTI